MNTQSITGFDLTQPCPCGEIGCDRRHLKVIYNEEANFRDFSLINMISGARLEKFSAENSAEIIEENNVAYLPYGNICLNLTRDDDDEMLNEIAQFMGDRYGIRKEEILFVEWVEFYTYNGIPLNHDGTKFSVAAVADNHRQALYACMVAKAAIENPDLDAGDRVEALRDAWRYLNFAVSQAETQFDLTGIEELIEEPSQVSI